MKGKRKVGYVRVAGALGALVVLGGGGIVRAQQRSPLPTSGPIGLTPVVVIGVDTSSSMKACDGGTFDPTNPPVALSLYNPRTDDGSLGDKGDCTGTRSDTAPYPLSRLEAAKLALADVLDADNNKVSIDSADEAVLKIKLGLFRFGSNIAGDNENTIGTTVSDYPQVTTTAQLDALQERYRVNLDSTQYQPVGSSFLSVWNVVKQLKFTSVGTPHGAFVAGLRAVGASPCYDGVKVDTNSDGQDDLCKLDSGEQDATTGDDLYYDCRNYYAIYLTDGSANGGSSVIGEDGVPIAKRLLGLASNPPAVYAPQLAYTNEATDLNGIRSGWGTKVTRVPVRTLVIGLSNDVTTPGSDERGQINCMSFWASGGILPAFEANLDLDSNPSTMDDDANAGTASDVIAPQLGSYPGTTTSGLYCNSYNNFADGSVQTYYGNGFFANNATQISSALRSILTTVGYGQFAGSQPITVNTGATNAGRAVYGTYFDVLFGKKDWRGHLRKYRFDSDANPPAYVDCDNPGTTSTPVKACWDAGGRAVWTSTGTLSLATFRNEASTDTSTYGLYDRNWRTRRVFVAAPDLPADMSILAYNDDTSKEAALIHETGYTGRTVKNMVAPLDAFGTFPPTLASVASLVTGAPTLYALAAYSTMVNTDKTAIPTTTLTDAQKVAALENLFFAVGRPDARYSDGTTLRCDSPPCTPDTTTPVQKLGDAFHSRPVLVGAPAGLVSDSDYYAEFLVRDLGSATSYGGLEDVSASPPAYTASADPCDGVAPCQVKNRRKVVYLAANDGMVHAFDDKTGVELWAYVPLHHLRNLDRLRTGRSPMLDANPLVRDVKFPLDAGARNADGKWHTMLIYTAGVGGNFVFALDVTNPVDPKFLWEYRKPDRMGLVVARAAVGELPAGSNDDGQPGAAVWVTGGYPIPYPAEDLETDPPHVHLFSLRPHNGKKLKDKHTEPIMLDPTATDRPIDNGLIGEPRPVDGDQDGKIDRVYFGDTQGRLWKACNIGADGSFELKTGGKKKPFFDPALYDNPDNGGAAEAPGEPKSEDTTGALSGVTDRPADRKKLRGPIYFAPDVTQDVDGKLVVAFGSGDLNDVLNPPQSYRNFMWVVKDDPNDSCSKAIESKCQGTTGLNTIDFGSGAFNNVRVLNDHLTAAPLFFNKYLLYAEFDVTQGCPSSYTSRVFAVDAFTCGTPGQLPFTNSSGSPTNVIQYGSELVSGLYIDPKGYLTVQSSRPNGPPETAPLPGLGMGVTFAGFRQLN